jgi:hypothetical protein
VAGGSYGVLADADATGTIFSSRVRAVGPDDRVLKDGAMNAKIGGDVLVGRLNGARIFTLTLEERATCPRSCAHLAGCYGNAMPHPVRWQADDAFEDRLSLEIAELCAAHETVLVRLHILGDFYSARYVWLWLGYLTLHPNLNVFGFTAWTEDSAIGEAVATVRAMEPDRFMIRNSGRTGTWGSFDITDPFPEKTIGDAIVCPEQRESNLGDSEPLRRLRRLLVDRPAHRRSSGTEVEHDPFRPRVDWRHARHRSPAEGQGPHPRASGPQVRVVRSPLGPGKDRPEFDHHDALINGGENRETNLRALCGNCHGD